MKSPKIRNPEPELYLDITWSKTLLFPYISTPKVKECSKIRYSKNLLEPKTVRPLNALLLVDSTKVILGYSPLACLTPIIPPETVPEIVKVAFLILIIGVSIYIVPPFLFKILIASTNSFSLSEVIVAISSSSTRDLNVFFKDLHINIFKEMINKR